MHSFEPIFARAVARHGEAELIQSLPAPLDNETLSALPDALFLSEMTKCIFRAGFVWRVVEQKWPDFEAAFAGFNPDVVARFSDERIDALLQDTRVIRHHTKLLATRANAAFVLETRATHGSFGNFLASWPDDDITGLLRYLKQHGNRLGGHSGQYFLRFVGKDTFIFSRDVVRVLVGLGIVDKEPTSKRGLDAVQAQFNNWRKETGLACCQLSRIMAASV